MSSAPRYKGVRMDGYQWEMHFTVYQYNTYWVPDGPTFRNETILAANCFMRTQLLGPREKSESRQITTSRDLNCVQGTKSVVDVDGVNTVVGAIVALTDAVITLELDETGKADTVAAIVEMPTIMCRNMNFNDETTRSPFCNLNIMLSTRDRRLDVYWVILVLSI